MPAPVKQATLLVAADLWKRKDAPFGVVDAWSQDMVAFRISGNPLAGVLRMLLPDKTRWGVA